MAEVVAERVAAMAVEEVVATVTRVMTPQVAASARVAMLETVAEATASFEAVTLVRLLRQCSEEVWTQSREGWGALDARGWFAQETFLASHRPC